MPESDQPARIVIGGDLSVDRLAYGAMHLTGPGMWGPYPDPDHAITLLRRAVDLGIDFIDTADSYGPADNERIIRQALYPYPDHLVISTKGGLLRTGPGDWEGNPDPYIAPCGRPAYLRQQLELSLCNLGVECIDLYQLHAIDPAVPLADQLGELVTLQQEGKIRHIGISGQPGVGPHALAQAAAHADITAVENLYNIADRSTQPSLDYAETHHLAYLCWFPLGHGPLAGPDGPLAAAAARFGATPAQLALAWLLNTSPNTVAIPGTTSLVHLEDNVRAAQIRLSDSDSIELTRLADGARGTPTPAARR